MKKLLLIALLIVGCNNSTEPQDCAGEIDKNVELWGECYNIEETTYLDLSDSGLTGEIPIDGHINFAWNTSINYCVHCVC